MSAMRVLLIAVVATSAFALKTVPEETIVPEVEMVVDEPSAVTPSLDDHLARLDHTAKGATVAKSDQHSAIDEPSDVHDEVSCAQGKVICPDGTCADSCPTLVAVSGSKTGYEYTFRPNPTKLDAVPPVAGKEADYQAMASNFHASQTSEEQNAITAAEQSAGFGFAAHDAAMAEHQQRLAAQEQEVEKLMNLAAAAAAAFKGAAGAHDEAVVQVKKSQQEEQAQEEVVKQAEETLKAEKERLKQAKQKVTAMVASEQEARYQAEYKGQVYTQEKAKAIAKDNALQEQKHETQEKEKFRQVAMAAVKNAAEAELKKAKASAHEVANPNPHHHADGTCSDCTTLPAVYTSAGGSCADCSKWAEKGECQQAEYAKFMNHYCAKSCGCNKAPETAQLQESKPKKH